MWIFCRLPSPFSFLFFYFIHYISFFYYVCESISSREGFTILISLQCQIFLISHNSNIITNMPMCMMSESSLHTLNLNETVVQTLHNLVQTNLIHLNSLNFLQVSVSLKLYFCIVFMHAKYFPRKLCCLLLTVLGVVPGSRRPVK